MYTDTTYQDWLSSNDRLTLMQQVISRYKASQDFLLALEADDYFHARNRAVAKKVILRADAVTREETDEHGKRVTRSLQRREVPGNRIYSNFLFRFVTQQNQYLLGNGVTLEDAAQKARLGMGFDNALQRAGEKALLHGVCWGYWNSDHLEVIPAATDALSGAVALLDERTGEAGVVIQFWQLSAQRPMYVRLFEPDGLTEYRTVDGGMVEFAPKRAYRLTMVRDGAGSYVAGAENYGRLPVVPFYANVDTTPEYLSNTTGDVSTDNFYWASRLLAAMADASYAKSVFHIERYTLSVGSKANGIINAYDDAQRGEADPAARAALRTKANEELAAMVRAETTDALNKVLFELSSGMKNAYSRSDA